MKKMIIAVMAFVIVLGTAFVAEAGTKLSDFERVTYADTVFHDETGAVRTFAASPFCETGSDAMKIFEEQVSLPQSVVDLYNRFGGRITIVDNPFRAGDFGPDTLVEGSCTYDTFDIKLATHVTNFSTVECVRWVGNNCSHELGHYVEKKTKPYWTEKDFLAYEMLKGIYNGTGKSRQIVEDLQYPERELNDEIFARTFADFYGRGLPLEVAALDYPPEILEFMNHITAIAAEMVIRGY